MGNISHTSGNVGIGTASPLVPLHVEGGNILVGRAGYIEQDVNFTGIGSAGGYARGLLFTSGGITAGFGVSGNHTTTSHTVDNIFLAHGGSPWSSGTGLYVLRNGDVGIGTTSPTAKLDVNGGIKGTNITASGTVTVGNFGGSTNVMVKPTLTAGVGQIVPLFASSNGPPTPFLPTGTWFISITGHMNVNSGGPDENTVLFGSFTVTVPSGEHFSMAPYNSNAAARNPGTQTEQGRSGLVYRFFTSTADQATVIASSSTVPTGWTEFTESGSAPFKAKRYSQGSGIALSAPTVSDGHSVVYQLDATVGWVFLIAGYAIRIA